MSDRFNALEHSNAFALQYKRGVRDTLTVLLLVALALATVAYVCEQYRTPAEGPETLRYMEEPR